MATMVTRTRLIVTLEYIACLVYIRNLFYQVKRNVVFAYCNRIDIRQILLKNLCLPTQLHGIRSHKAVILTFSALTNSNFTELNFPETSHQLIIWIITTELPDRDKRKASRIGYTAAGEMTLQATG